MNLTADSSLSDAPASRSARLRARIRTTARNMLHGLVPKESAIRMAQTNAPLDAAHFEEAVCRNCGTVRSEPHCGACGQKAVARFGFIDVFNEFWQSWRLFELAFIHDALRVLYRPGLVAREYVLGARKRHVHPLKLLLFAVGLLVLLLGRTAYLTAGQASLDKAMTIVAAWSRWSFSLGLFAVLGASLLVFHRRLAYNAVEHLVLAVYAQFVVLVLNLAYLSPLLALDTARWVPAWRATSAWVMTPLELLVIALAYQQFFRLRWRADAWRIALAVALAYAFKKALLFAYGRLIVHVVMAQTA